jgi:hypothetical protein
MKSLDQVDSFTKEASGHILHHNFSVGSTSSKDDEHVKMQSGVGACANMHIVYGLSALTRIQ